jgi:hypothetical protein
MRSYLPTKGRGVFSPSALVFSADERLLIKLDTALISLASIGMPVTLYPCRDDAVLPIWFEAASPVEGQILHTTRVS